MLLFTLSCYRTMNSKIIMPFSTMAIAAVVLLFASGPIVTNHNALAVVYYHGHYGHYHGHYHYRYHGHYHYRYHGHYRQNNRISKTQFFYFDNFRKIKNKKGKASKLVPLRKQIDVPILMISILITSLFLALHSQTNIIDSRPLPNLLFLMSRITQTILE